MDNDRLQDAAGADVLGQLRELVFRELGARVARVLIEEVDGSEQRFARGNGTALKKSAWSGLDACGSI